MREKVLAENVILPPSPPSPHPVQKISRNQKICETQNSSPTMFFGIVRKQTFYRKSCYSTLSHKFFRYPKLFKLYRIPQWRFSTQRDRKFVTDNRDKRSPHLILDFFRYQKLRETQKGCPTKFFGTLRQQIFDRKLCYSPRTHKSSRYPRILTH